MIKKLRDYDLSFEDLIGAIRRSSLALSAGSLRTPVGSIMIRTDGQAYTQEDFANIVVTAADGAQDPGPVTSPISRMGSKTPQMITRFNGEPAIMIDILRAADENAIEISDAVHRYIEEASNLLPNGVGLSAWDDESIRIRGRLSTLGNSLLMGAGLVFLVSRNFPPPHACFLGRDWHPHQFCRRSSPDALLWPHTANTMSIFAFIIVLGIVVDDAIITGENHLHQTEGGYHTPRLLLFLGTKEVATPVTFGGDYNNRGFYPPFLLPWLLGLHGPAKYPQSWLQFSFFLSSSRN